MDAAAIVELARNWTLVHPVVIYTSPANSKVTKFTSSKAVSTIEVESAAGISGA